MDWYAASLACSVASWFFRLVCGSAACAMMALMIEVVSRPLTRPSIFDDVLDVEDVLDVVELELVLGTTPTAVVAIANSFRTTCAHVARVLGAPRKRRPQRTPTSYCEPDQPSSLRTDCDALFACASIETPAC